MWLWLQWQLLIISGMHQDMEITLITCSGISNTGKATARAGDMLISRSSGVIDIHLSARSDPEDLARALAQSDRIVVLDGCSDCCGRKKVAEHGYSPDIHLIATECGVIKNRMEEPRFDEIEALYARVREQIRRSE